MFQGPYFRYLKYGVTSGVPVRAGQFFLQPGGYSAFVPADLPPKPPLAFDSELIQLLSDADRELGRLDGVTTVLPHPDLFVAMYVRHEAVLSSQIEGTQSTLDDVLQFQIGSKGDVTPKDVAEVVNYIDAMNYGLGRINHLPLSQRLIREIHGELMKGVRGGDKTPGEFRQTQNWIGPKDSTLSTATFVPPPVIEMLAALKSFEIFLHDTSLPVLIQCGLAHAQFETIHPFHDGNGRIGRLLIALLLCTRGVLHRPLLYLSLFLKANQAEYYDRLMAVRKSGAWEEWMKFFLRGVAEVSRSATNMAKSIIRLREEHRLLIREKLANHSANAFPLLDYLFENPLTTVNLVKDFLDCSYLAANNLVGEFVKLGLLRETTGGVRNRKFRFDPYLKLFDSLSNTNSMASVR